MNVRQKRHKHAAKRAKQRYNLVLNHDDRKNIILLIKQNKTKHINTYTNSKSLHMVNYKNEDLFVIYSRTTKSIVTILPKDCEEYKEYLNGNEQKTKTDAEQNGWKENNIDNRFNVEFTERMLDMPETI